LRFREILSNVADELLKLDLPSIGIITALFREFQRYPVPCQLDV